jgi:hypothetical protein
MPQVICLNCGNTFEAKRADARLCSARCRKAESRKLSVTSPVRELSVTEPETTGAKQYVIPAKPYIEKPFTFVQPKAVWGAELALKFTNAR